MSNPLIKPNDPRFQNRGPLDDQGQNRFAEPADLAAQTLPTATENNLFAASAPSDERPFEPEYQTTLAHRGMLLLILAIVGLTGSAGGTLTLTGVLALAWILPLLAMFPSGAAAFLAFEDLRAMRLGAMDRSGLVLTRIACGMGVAGILCSLLALAAIVLFALGAGGGLS